MQQPYFTVELREHRDLNLGQASTSSSVHVPFRWWWVSSLEAKHDQKGKSWTCLMGRSGLMTLSGCLKYAVLLQHLQAWKACTKHFVCARNYWVQKLSCPLKSHILKIQEIRNTEILLQIELCDFFPQNGRKETIYFRLFKKLFLAKENVLFQKYDLQFFTRMLIS